MSTFNEADHPRTGTGQFTDKTHAEADVTIPPYRPFQDQMWAANERIRQDRQERARAAADYIRTYMAAEYPGQTVIRCAYGEDDDVSRDVFPMADQKWDDPAAVTKFRNEIFSGSSTLETAVSYLYSSDILEKEGFMSDEVDSYWSRTQQYELTLPGA